MITRKAQSVRTTTRPESPAKLPVKPVADLSQTDMPGDTLDTSDGSTPDYSSVQQPPARQIAFVGQPYKHSTKDSPDHLVKTWASGESSPSAPWTPEQSNTRCKAPRPSSSRDERRSTAIALAENSIATWQPTFSLVDQAIWFTFRNYLVPITSMTNTRSMLLYVMPMYLASYSNSPLRIATASVALCALSKVPGRRSITSEACVYYGRAMRAVSEAIRDPAQATSDDTLMAVLILGMYEVCRLRTRPVATRKSLLF